MIKSILNPARSIYLLWRPVLSLLFLSAILGTSPLFAGAWVQPQGSYYVKLWVAEFRADQEFGLQGERQRLYLAAGSWRQATLEERSAGLYAECGLTPQLTLVASLPWKRLTRSATDILEPINPNIRNRSSGMGDLSMGLRRLLSSAPLVSSIQIMGRIPAGYQVGPAPTQLNDTPVLPRGNGARALSLEILAGQSRSRLYATGGLGYRVQSGRPDNEILYTAELGFYPLPALLVRGTIDGSRTRADDLHAPRGVAVVIDQDLLKLDLGLILSLSSTLQLSLDRIFFLSGRNTPAGSQTFIALALKE